MSSTQSSLASSSRTDRLGFLIRYGSSLASLHRRSKTRKTNNWVNEHDENIADKIKKFKEELKSAKQSLPPSLASYSLDERSKHKIVERVKGIVGKLIDIEPANKGCYKELVDELDEIIMCNSHSNLKSQKQDYLTGVSCLPSQVMSSSEAAAYDLNLNERSFLASCHQFMYAYSCFPGHMLEISNGFLINWLIGTDIIGDPLEGEQFLSKLVAEPSFNLVRALRGSRIIIVSDNKSNQASVNQNDPETVHVVDNTRGYITVEYSKKGFVVLANRSMYTLVDINLEIFFRREIKITSVYFGKFHCDKDYVAASDSFWCGFDGLLQAQTNIRLLSLNGVSMIQRLPDSVCSLSNLRVLDLKSCQDLKFLPQDIGCLVELVVLDLSECYQLEYIPKGVSKLTKLRVLKGFIIVDMQPCNQDHQTADLNNLSPLEKLVKMTKHRLLKCFSVTDNNTDDEVAYFDDLSALKKLIKLTIRTRRMNFPTNQDLQALQQMQELMKLKVVWVKSFIIRSTDDTTDAHQSDNNYYYTQGLPTTLKKLELQAAPETTASRLLGLISKRIRCRGLEKLYIRGGELQKLDTQQHCFQHVKILRLRYLPQLRIGWQHFQLAFPNLSYLQIYRCPNLIFFPCDENGEWIQSESSW